MVVSMNIHFTMIRTALVSALLWVSQSLLAQPAGYDYGMQIVIQSGQVAGSTPLIDFPLLINLTEDDLRSVANGGLVRHDLGYDIVFTAADGVTVLNHQIERYVNTTGELVAWVRIPSLDPLANTTVNMFYGNPTVAASPSTTATWTADYLGVYHFNSSVADNGPASNNLAFRGLQAVYSKVGVGVYMPNTSNLLSNSTSGSYMEIQNDAIFSGVTDFTFSGWVYLVRDNTNWERIFDFGINENTNFFLTPSVGTGSPAESRARITTGGGGGEQGVIAANTTANTGRWIHWAVTINAATDVMTMYRDGQVIGTAAGVSLTPSNMGTSGPHYFGRSHYLNNDHYAQAAVDEFRLSTTAKSADWIATEYNNQNDPASFYTVSTTVASAALPVEFFSFSVGLTKEQQVTVEWQTVSESLNDYFTVQRSPDGNAWEDILVVLGKGDSYDLSTYHAIDPSPLPGLSYYRIRQTDTDGTSTYSDVRSLWRLTAGEETLTAYPNPFTRATTVEAAGLLDQLRVYNASGQQIDDLVVRTPLGENRSLFDFGDLPAGTYILQTPRGVRRIQKH